MKIRKVSIIILLLLCLAGLVFRRGVYRVIVAGVQLMEGKKTVGQRVDEYGDVVRRRLLDDFTKTGVAYPPESMVLIGLKQEKLLEVWVSGDRQTYHLLKTYPILKMSGKLGPKLLEGDKQVPEGLYGVDSLNPNSRFHLSLRIDYPNEFDRQMARQDGRTSLGGDIMIHGCQVSIGCLAMGDTAAEDIFVLAALTKPENIRVILCPVDFRVRDFDGDLSKLPDWVGQLYQQIKDEMVKFSK
jgi:hypothetical protein